ncbi:pPIWI_RE module domain-containing protein [Kitasatospora sp. NPDC096147]|uniref:pPIWI_RE module domain-containing protein n=1 Tax=Kitasatospora sp. NPDC096147 TaxID=3364093 RepID=UPI0038186CB9
MGFSYRTVSRAAYHLAPDAAPWTTDYRALPFPEHARASLLELCNHGREEKGGTPYRTVPTYRMDGVLQSLAPDLVVRGRPSTPVGPDEDFWLYVPAGLPHPLPDRTMYQLLDVWLRDLGHRDVLGTEGYRKLLLETSAELRAAPLVWQDVPQVDLLGGRPTEGGTAAPTGRQYQLATDALARRIMALDPYQFEGGELRFRAIPRGPRDQGAELMSQPYSRDVNGKPWWFSITINISLHTVPFDPRPRLHLHTGVRRWATYPRADTGSLHLPYRRATTVYLSPSIPWLPGAPTSERYAVARLTRVRGNGDDSGMVDWLGNGPAGILRGLTLRQNFPDPAELLSTPMRWLGDGPGVRAAVVHSNHMGAHGIGAGLMSHQRSLVTEWAEQALPEGLVRAPELIRSTTGSDKPGNVRLNVTGTAKKAEEVRAAHARRAALAVAAQLQTDGASVPSAGLPVVEARLLWQTAELRQAAVGAFAEILGLDGDGGAPQPDHSNPDAVAAAFDSARPGSPVLLQWHTPELTVRLRCLPLSGGIADRLDLGTKTGPKGKVLAEAVKIRRSELVDFLAADGAAPEAPSLALVEIAHPSTFRPSITDPKFAVRLGCADAGVLTQFAVVPSNAKGIKTQKNVDHRVRSGWLDGLRQLGVRVLPEHTLGGELSEGLRYAAVWMVKRRKDGPTRLPLHLPVAVLVTPLPQGDGLAQVQGWDDDTADWIPYPSFLLGLVKKAEIPGTEPDPAIPDQRTDSEATTPAPPNRRTAWRKNMDQQRKETASFLQRVVFSLRGRPTTLITHSQNSRNHWPWLQDGKTMADLIRTGHAPAAGLDMDLRLVRIRGAAGRETPQWWGTGSPDGINGLPAGLWTQQDEPGADQRVFYSTTEKASQFKASATRADRLAPRLLTKGKNVGELTSDADKPAWNPALVEIAVLGCHPDAEADGPGDNPEAIALAMHQLRQAPDYLDALSLPLPLHLAGLAQAYVLPMFADGTDGGAEDGTADADPDLADAPGLAQEPEPEGQLALFG